MDTAVITRNSTVAASAVNARPSACVTDVLRRWSAGDDTAAIAAALGMAQADICRIVAADQDRRYAARHRAGLV